MPDCQIKPRLTAQYSELKSTLADTWSDIYNQLLFLCRALWVTVLNILGSHQITVLSTIKAWTFHVVWRTIGLQPSKRGHFKYIFWRLIGHQRWASFRCWPSAVAAHGHCCHIWHIWHGNIYFIDHSCLFCQVILFTTQIWWSAQMKLFWLCIFQLSSSS